MFLTACQHPKVPHLMAILKRTIVIIAGHRGVYLRLPNESNDQRILCFRAGGITQDWLRETNKAAYGLFKQGVHQKHSTFDVKLEEEQALVGYLLGTAEEKKYMERAHMHDRWRTEASASEAPPASSHARPPVPALEAPAPTAPVPPARPQTVQLKEEPIASPIAKKARVFGVIDVDELDPATPPQVAAGPRSIALIDDDMDEEENEDVFQFGRHE